jgi:hypothetical protein
MKMGSSFLIVALSLLAVACGSADTVFEDESQAQEGTAVEVSQWIGTTAQRRCWHPW